MAPETAVEWYVCATSTFQCNTMTCDLQATTRCCKQWEQDRCLGSLLTDSSHKKRTRAVWEKCLHTIANFKMSPIKSQYRKNKLRERKSRGRRASPQPVCMKSNHVAKLWPSAPQTPFITCTRTSCYWLAAPVAEELHSVPKFDKGFCQGSA